MKRLLITICGRAGSKGFKNKNLKNFCGKPRNCSLKSTRSWKSTLR